MRVRLWGEKENNLIMILIGRIKQNKKQSQDDSIKTREEIWAHSNVVFYSLEFLYFP